MRVDEGVTHWRLTKFMTRARAPGGSIFRFVIVGHGHISRLPRFGHVNNYVIENGNTLVWRLFRMLGGVT